MNEKKIMSMALAVMALSCICWGDSVLWWMVDDPTITLRDGTTTVSAQNYTSPEGYMVNSARVRVENGQNTSYLQLYAQTENGAWQLTPATGAWTDDGNGNWTGTGWVPTSLGSFDDTQTSFLIELGYVDAGGAWTTLAVSETATRNNLAQHISLGGVGTQPQVAWQPAAYAVPEPTSGLLLMTGAMLLLLKRRRFSDSANEERKV